MLPADIVPFNCTTLAVITDSAGQLVPIIDVTYKKDMRWSMPAEMSSQIYQKYLNGEDVVYTWDWGAALASLRQKENRFQSTAIGLIFKHGSRST